MRTDIPVPFQTAMMDNGRRPRLLCVFHFAAGDVFISDQTLGTADGLTDEYTALVEEWGDLATVGDPSRNDAGEVRSMRITIWNGGTSPFSDWFLDEDPENVEVEIFQWFYGMPESGKVLIDRFVCQDPIHYDETSRLLTIDLCSMSMLYDGPVGDVLTIQNWPNCKDEDLGKYVPIVLGDPLEVKTACVRTAPKATLDGSILEDTTTIPCIEDLDEEGFSQSGSIQIDAERITYSSRTEHDFIVSQRGADGTLAVEHLNETEVQEHVTDFTYVIGKGPIKSVSDVLVEGVPADSGIYSADVDSDPARIVFTEKPYGKEYSKGSTFLEMQFDATDSSNTAIQPHLAYDAASVTSAAQINETYPCLAVKQVTLNPDRGEIVRAYLAVEWWASDAALQHDRISVSIDGIGTLGYLERPSQDDTLVIDAEVDIDHGHSHSISGEHVHILTQPVFGTQESPHGHGSTGLIDTTRRAASSQLSIAPNMTGAVTVPGPSAYSAATLHCRTSPNYGVKVSVSGQSGGEIITGSGDSYVAISPNAGTCTLTFRNFNSGGFTMMVYEIWIDYIVTSSIAPAVTGVSVLQTGSAANALDSDKATTDVVDLLTQNRDVTLNSSGMPTKSVVELFDITANVNLDWSWFTDKVLKVTYEGTVDNQTVYILHTFFDVEFRRSQRFFSDNVTVKCLGLRDDDDGTYTGTPAGLITRPDHVRKYLLLNRGGLPADRIDADSWTLAGDRYRVKDYSFDGIIPGDRTVRECERSLSWQCRSRWFWDAGRAFMKFRESLTDWTIDRDIYQTDAPIRMKSMKVERKKVKDILNRVNVYYYRDWTSDKSGVDAYQSLSAHQNNESIFVHGVREVPELFMFDQVRVAAMAGDLGEFYLETGSPSSIVTFDAFLPYFDFQKEDYLRLTHSFGNFRKAAMRILDIQRTFGSGKIKRMNLLRIVAESWFKLISIVKGDQSKLTDMLRIDQVLGMDIITGVGLLDVVVPSWLYSEGVTTDEDLVIAIAFILAQSDGVSVTEAVGAAMDIALSDSVVATDYADMIVGHGFGMGEFGMDPFGSESAIDNNPVEYTGCTEVLITDEAAVLADTATATDVLVFGSGFGALWSQGSGFGDTPFGDEPQLENYEEHTEVDSGGTITVTGPHEISFTDVHTRTAEGMIYRDMGSDDFFFGDFEFTVEMNLTTLDAAGLATPFGVAQYAAEDVYDSDAANHNSIWIFLNYWGGAYVWYIDEIQGINTYSSTVNDSASVVGNARYLRIKRVEGVGASGMLYLTIYSDAAMTNIVCQKTHALHAAHDYRYLYAFANYTDGWAIGDAHVSGTFRNLKLIGKSQDYPFRNFIQVDPLGKITLNPFELFVEHVPARSSATYVYRDMGAAYFAADFTLTCKIHVNENMSGQYIGFMSVQNALEDTFTAMAAGHDLIHLALWYDGINYTWYLSEISGGGLRQTAVVDNGMIGRDSWVRLRRYDAGGVFGFGYITVAVYSDVAMQTLVTSMTLDIAGHRDFRYLYACNSYNDGAGANTTDWKLEEFSHALSIV